MEVIVDSGTLYFTSIRKAKGEAFTPCTSCIVIGAYLCETFALQCDSESSVMMARSSILFRSPPARPDHTSHNESNHNLHLVDSGCQEQSYLPAVQHYHRVCVSYPVYNVNRGGNCGCGGSKFAAVAFNL